MQNRNGIVDWAAIGLVATLGLRLLGRLKPMSVRGKVVLVTGASRGLGLVIARRFAALGADVAIVGSDAEELERAREKLAGAGRPVLPLVADLRDPDAIDRLLARVYERFGGVDVLVNNAGVIQVGPASEMTLSDYEESMAVHFWAPLRLTLGVVEQMRRRGGGRIVNISSIGGLISVPHLLPLSAGKFALTGLSQGMHAALAEDGIEVTTVCPGLLRTGSPLNALFKGRHRSEYAWFTLSDSLPILSMNAQRAADRIVRACRRGESFLVLTWAAKFAFKMNALFPSVTTYLLTLANGLLPAPGGIGRATARGRDSTSRMAPSWLTGLTERAAARNNQYRS